MEMIADEQELIRVVQQVLVVQPEVVSRIAIAVSAQPNRNRKQSILDGYPDLEVVVGIRVELDLDRRFFE